MRSCPGAGLVVTHHDRKASSEDFLDKASGTRGITGGPDTIMVLVRPRLGPDGTLMITGRDVDENAYAMTFEEEPVGAGRRVGGRGGGVLFGPADDRTAG